MNYTWDEQLHLFHRATFNEFAYSDGEMAEAYLLTVVSQAKDRRTFSPELAGAIKDWPSEYHLSRARHCLVRPLGIRAGDKVLELGCGCGAVTRYLGEMGANVVAVEGSLTRARVAAERSRELPNVRVVVDDLLRFDSEDKFDWVLLIGVLEYAAMFSPGQNPFQDYLRSVSRFRAAGGRVVVAIENKLGLKYFNGCGEDHVGVPYFGIQDMYGARTPRTFGRQELVAQLAAAGMPSTYFYYPFPDYKLPSVVLAEDALTDAHFDAIDLIVRSQARDYSGSPYRGFDEALAFAAVAENGLLGDLSNSFLVVAAPEGELAVPAGELAMAFSYYRAPQFATQTRFVRDGPQIKVLKEHLLPANGDRSIVLEGTTINHRLPESDYRPGRQITWRLLRARAQSGELKPVVEALRPWMEYLLRHARVGAADIADFTGQLPSLTSYVVPGDFLDCTPFNVLESGKEFAAIDLEWCADRDVPLGWVVTRGVLWSLTSGMPIADHLPSAIAVIEALCQEFKFSVSESSLHAWLQQEADFQTAATGRLHSVIPTDKTSSGMLSMVTEIASLQQAVATQDGQLAARQEQIDTLTRGVTARDQQIAMLQHEVTARDRQIVREAEQAQARIAALKARLSSANTKLGSLSWKITKPLRSLSSAFPRPAKLFQKGLQVAYWALTLQLPRRLRQRKVARLLLDSGIFDPAFYLAEYPDVADAGVNPLLHYLACGAREGRKPNPYFDAAYYVQNNPDVAASGADPLVHYLLEGFREGREPGPKFSGRLYLAQNPDVAASGMNPLAHFLKYGAGEGRRIPPPQPCTPAPSDPSKRAALLVRARDGARRILVIDECVPAPDMDSGSVRMFGLLRLLAGFGFPVTFASNRLENDKRHIEALKTLAIAVLVGYAEIRAHLQQRGSGYSVVVLSRPETAATYLPPVRAYAPYAEVIYDSVDLHHVRYRRAAELSGDPHQAKVAASYLQLETLGFTLTDKALAITETEKQMILQTWPETVVEVVPNVHSIRISSTPWRLRKGLVFIGGYDHEPNVDAVVWFVREIFPQVLEQIPDVRFTILGSKAPECIRQLAGANVDVVGWVPDPDPHFEASRIFVAPLRYGAGMKGKVGQAMSLGLPVVTTPVGAEGMQLVDGVHALIAEDAGAFAAAVVRLYNDEALWTSLQRAAALHIERNFSEDAVRKILERVLASEVASTTVASA